MSPFLPSTEYVIRIDDLHLTKSPPLENSNIYSLLQILLQEVKTYWVNETGLVAGRFRPLTWFSWFELWTFLCCESLLVCYKWKTWIFFAFFFFGENVVFIWDEFLSLHYLLFLLRGMIANKYDYDGGLYKRTSAPKMTTFDVRLKSDF